MSRRPLLTRLTPSLLAIGVLLFGSSPPLRALAAGTISIAGAQLAIDSEGTLDFERAQSLPYVSADRYTNPGLARPLRPLVVWLRLPPQPIWNVKRWYFEASADVGWATLYYVPRGAARYESIVFGMRQPYRARELARLQPTIRIPKSAAVPMYVRLAIDEESRIVPPLRAIDRATVDAEDKTTDDLGALALVFAGIFISLAVANLFVFAFIRERAYAWYTGWMLANALFACVYLHNAAWKWLWPNASLPEEPVAALVVLVEGVLLLGFTREFLESYRFVPRADRFVVRGCLILLGVAVFGSLVEPSFQPFGAANGRDLFLVSAACFVLLTFALGVAAMRRGSAPARFFLVANAAVVLAAVAVAISNMFQHHVGAHADFLSLMAGQSLEGWLLFGALAYRFREIARDYAAEQERRIEAQTQALEQTRHLLEERRNAVTDALTGIANRRAFDETLAREWERCGRAHAPISLLIADIDFFKGFNDTYGHVLGDDCLRKVAKALDACATRPADLCARYGGEEFGVVLPETDEAGAYTIAGEMSRYVRALNLPHRGSSLGYVTVSIGAASVIPEPGSKPSVTQLADECLYRAKQSGRNRVASPSAIDKFAPRADRVEAPPLRGVH